MEQLNQAIQLLKERLDPDFILLFGSFATGNQRKSSDIDLAFHKRNHTFTSYDLFLLSGELADIFKRDVDLIDLCQATTVLKGQIYGAGKLVYYKDEQLFFKEQMTALSMYVRFNEERRSLIEDIKKRGYIYE